MMATQPPEEPVANAAPDPPSSPGAPVPAPAAMPNLSPESPNPMTVPYAGSGWRIPALP